MRATLGVGGQAVLGVPHVHGRGLGQPGGQQVDRAEDAGADGLAVDLGHLDQVHRDAGVDGPEEAGVPAPGQ